MYRVGNRTFKTFHEVILYANSLGLLFDPDIEDLVDGYEAEACKALEKELQADSTLE
jgi:hypothetical protein